MEYLAAAVDDELYGPGIHLALADVYGGFNHGKDVGLGSETIVFHVSALCLIEFRRDVVEISVLGKTLRNELFGFAETLLVLPQRVVGIECHYLDLIQHGTNVSKKTETGMGGVPVRKPCCPEDPGHPRP